MVVSALYNNGLSGLGGNVFYHTNTTSTSSSSSKKYNSIEELEEARRKYNQKFLTQQADAIRVEKENLEILKEATERNNELDKGLQSDGSSIVVKDFKKLTWWDKVKIGGMNMLKGIGNVCKSVVGIEADGSFNLKKCIRNVAIAVGVGIACTFAAPIAASVAGLLGASAAVAGACGTVAASAVTALTYAGVAAGTFKVGKGIYDACKANSTEEFDKATQDMGQGAFIAITSKLGLKGGAKTAGVLSKIQKPNLEGASLFGKALGYTKYTGRCLGRDLGNLLPVRPTSLKFWKKGNWAISDYLKVSVKQGRAAGHAAVSAQAPTGATSRLGKISEFCSSKTGWYRVTQARQAIKDIPARIANHNFKIALNNSKNNIETQIRKIELSLSQNGLTDLQKATLNHKRNGLYDILNKLDDLKTHSDWRTLRKLSAKIAKDTDKMRGKWYTRPFTGNKEIEIQATNNTSYTFKRSELLDDLANISTEQRALASELQQLTRLRMESMSKMAKVNQYKDEVANFGFSSKTIARPTNWIKTKWDVGMSGLEKGMGAMNIGFIAMEPWWALQSVIKKPAFMPVNMLTLFHDPVIDKPEGEIISAEEVAKEKEEISKKMSEATIKIENANKVLDIKS